MSLTVYQRKRRKQLLMGLPAILMGCACLMGVISKPFYAIEKKVHRYRTSATTALKSSQEGDDEAKVLALKKAQLCYEKIWQLDPNDHNSLFYVAQQIVQQTGDPAPIARLAPLHEPRAAAAHRWIARQLLVQGGDLKQIHTHLTHVDTLKKREAGDNLLWYEYLSRAGDVDAAAECLATASNEQPALLFDLWKLQLEQGATSEATQTAQKVEKWLRLQIAKDPDEKANYARRFAILSFLKRPGELLNAGSGALARFEDDEVEAQYFAAATRLIQQLATSDSVSIADIEAIRNLVGSVLVRNETFRPLRIELDRIFVGRESGFGKQIVEDILRNSASEIVTTVAGHWGTLAAGEEDFATAQRLLERALEIDPADATVTNNLAWVLLQMDASKTDRALELVNRAIELLPADIRFVETRGQILMAREEWEAAIKDLETAVNQMPDSVEIHRSLAKAYREIGMTELARAHQRD